MNQLNNFHLKNMGIGAAGFGLLDIIPNVDHALQYAIAIITGVIQLVHLFKNNKKKSS